MEPLIAWFRWMCAVLFLLVLAVVPVGRGSASLDTLQAAARLFALLSALAVVGGALWFSRRPEPVPAPDGAPPKAVRSASARNAQAIASWLVLFLAVAAFTGLATAAGLAVTEPRRPAALVLVFAAVALRTVPPRSEPSEGAGRASDLLSIAEGVPMVLVVLLGVAMLDQTLMEPVLRAALLAALLWAALRAAAAAVEAVEAGDLPGVDTTPMLGGGWQLRRALVYAVAALALGVALVGAAAQWLQALSSANPPGTASGGQPSTTTASPEKGSLAGGAPSANAKPTSAPTATAPASPSVTPAASATPPTTPSP